MIKLLLVEDEEIIRSGIRHVIEQVGNEFEVVYEASHGREAWEYLSANLPDAVITDIRMREMDGLELTHKIRERFPELPVVIISGYGDFEYAQRALRLHVDDYLLKPVDRMALLTALDKIRARLVRPRPKDSAAADESPQAPCKSEDGRRLIRKIKEYIAAHPEGDLRLQTLADYVHLNPVYLSQLFKQETKSNLSDFITGVRIERAMHLLSTTELKIYDVARLSGYASPKHFMLVFKQQTGMTPTAFREKT